ncbi:6789_t:CDS:2, partial [Racocetra persica]
MAYQTIMNTVTPIQTPWITYSVSCTTRDPIEQIATLLQEIILTVKGCINNAIKNNVDSCIDF